MSRDSEYIINLIRGSFQGKLLNVWWHLSGKFVFFPFHGNKSVKISKQGQSQMLTMFYATAVPEQILKEIIKPR